MAMKEMKTLTLKDQQYEVVDAKAREDVAKKADKKVPSAAGNVATLDASGNLADGGKKYAPDARSVNMNSPVGVDANGKLWSHSTACRLYTVKWDKTANTMTRLNTAASIPTDTSTFRHAGTINAQYSNPFDSIYPWSGIKLCNIDIDRYMALKAGARVTDCVVAWEGDPDFSYTHENGVWRYRPEFWGRSWEDGTARYFEVTDEALGGYIHYPEAIEGRWHGVKVNRQVGGTAKDILLPLANQPSAAEYAISTMHTEAKNYGATLDSIYTVDANILLYLVEYANMNAQTAIGKGVDTLYQAGNKHPVEAATKSKTVKVLTTDAGIIIPGALFTIGDANDRGTVNRAVVVSKSADDAGNTTVTLDREVTITVAQFWNIHGLANVADEQIGSKSGYIGTDGKAIAYYRGLEMYANMFFYVLGAYREQTTNHVWIAKDIEEADKYDQLDKTVHKDTGLQLATGADGAAANGYIKTLGIAQGLAAAPICTAIGGDSTRPVGDYLWMPVNTAGNTILIAGGSAYNGLYCGPFSGVWGYASSNAWWFYCARPVLKNP